MEKLRPSDPARIGGHRLLGRLGAGGMGVVYLGRADTGALAAIKVILPEFAGDHDFRTRFRREVEAARRVNSPWAVPVTGAETEGEQPWLATAFVPGPALSEAVARCGPLPARSVRVLGRLLARALNAVHEAGLVHRDVKPGNVLLTVDGPRLIDFGIARAADATALTATDLVVGTPGFLSPEQAGGGSEAGPPSDVFSLGCLLAYAATGRPPFGSGAVDALLYRTVHDVPDLEGVEDPELHALLTELLAKNPMARPTAAELDTRMAEDVPHGSIDWLPEDVVALIADRSTGMLALPDIDPTTVPETPPQPGPGRRRVLLFAGAGVVVAAGGGLGLREWLRDDDEDATGSAAPGERAWVIGVQADLSGPQSAAGRAQERGVRLAVQRFNSRKDKPFALTVKALDDRGEAARAVQAAERFCRDRDVLAVVGPTGDRTTDAVLTTYDEAMLPVLTVSSLQLAYAARSKKPFFQAAPYDAALAAPIINRLLLRPDVERLGVLLDRAGGQSAYQSGYATNLLTGELTTGTTYPRVIPAGTQNLKPVVEDMLAHSSDAFYYAGDAVGAARTARALAATSFKGPRMAMHTAMGATFLEEAGEAAENWEFTAPFTDAEAPAAKEFAAAHRAAYRTGPAHWAAEAYDVAGLVIEAVTALARGTGGAGRPKRPARAALVKQIAASSYQGVSRTYTFDEDHRLKGADAYLYGVRDGRYVFLGDAPKTKA
ncbi:bifunctional serine/threonine-protein kinase/ABC transporter substrate-binding protein [Streptomyces sp. ITFR-16]|uniref:bifunctional serine/threonine-protein kinase/ABC transporter substrate-binding protein n=1 Tax=Streptomyces sp. ITFR-16 TaxID=3075198 RepID=UPI00288C16CF|nr:bifunctional serine/threonine-protein kinase/ABC transporter substrate-binding protein [Streptomyces sp. ITFR-16]WNI21709.1 bifunctional serine/threonine-protein kinase/ABC transporter substrate-binding protein [Streptomyces sp. ITFR-16]